MSEIALTNTELRTLKGRAQLLDPILKIGKNGVTEAFLRSVEEAFQHHDLIKIKFEEFKDQKKTLAPQIAEKTSSRMVMQVGNVFVLYRPRVEASAPEPEASV